MSFCTSSLIKITTANHEWNNQRSSDNYSAIRCFSMLLESPLAIPRLFLELYSLAWEILSEYWSEFQTELLFIRVYLVVHVHELLQGNISEPLKTKQSEISSSLMTGEKTNWGLLFSPISLTALHHCHSKNREAVVLAMLAMVLYLQQRFQPESNLKGLPYFYYGAQK